MEETKILLNEALLRQLQNSAKEIGAIVHVLPEVLVDYGDNIYVPFLENNVDVNPMAVRDSYPKIEAKEITETIILINWPNSQGSCKRALNWATENNLSSTTPHVLSPINTYHSDLNGELKDPCIVVETTGCIVDDMPYNCTILLIGLSDTDFIFVHNQKDLGHRGNWFAFCL